MLELKRFLMNKTVYLACGKYNGKAVKGHNFVTNSKVSGRRT